MANLAVGAIQGGVSHGSVAASKMRQRQDSLKKAMQFVPRSLQMGDKAVYEVAEGQRLRGGMMRGASGKSPVGKYHSELFITTGNEVKESFFDVGGKPINISPVVTEGEIEKFSFSIAAKRRYKFHESRDYCDREESSPEWRVTIKYAAKYQVIGSGIVKFRLAYDIIGEAAAAAAPLLTVPSVSKGSIEEAQARELMGAQFTGTKEWEELFGVVLERTPTLPADIIMKLNNECPFDKAKKTHATHILYFMPERLRGKDLSIMEWERVISGKEHRSVHKMGKFYDRKWYHDKAEVFAHKRVTGRGRWVLMPKEIVPGSTGKTWIEQETLVRSSYGRQGYEVPSALELVSGVMIHYLRTGERIYDSKFGRTTSVRTDGSHVLVGDFDSSGLSVSHWYDSYRNDSIGVVVFQHFV